jgi:hypothetical protein
MSVQTRQNARKRAYAVDDLVTRIAALLCVRCVRRGMCGIMHPKHTLTGELMNDKKNALQGVIETMEGLDRAELVKVQRALDTLLNGSKAPGHVEYKFIRRGDKAYGPYRYRRIWRGGKLRSVYEGKAEPGEYEAWQQRHEGEPGGQEGPETTPNPI